MNPVAHRGEQTTEVRVGNHEHAEFLNRELCRELEMRGEEG